MGKIITVAVQKGGVGKTTTAGIMAYFLSQNHKVLAIDMDSQGNLTEFLTQRDIYDFQDQTVLNAIKEQNAKKYIHPIRERLDLLTADDFLATLSRWMLKEKKDAKVLADALSDVKDDYEYIIIDTPPALSDQTLTALTASDYVVALFEGSQFAYSALERFFETVNHVQDMVNPHLQVAGILCSNIDRRRSDNKAYIDVVKDEYKDLVFDTIISRRAATARLAIEGFDENKELTEALEPYKPFMKELISRVESR